MTGDFKDSAAAARTVRKQGAGRPPAEPDTPTTTDAIEIAMDAERDDPDSDSPARRVLRKHERLIDAQTAQLGRLRWRDFIITALGVCVLAAGGLLVWDAARAKGVMVEAFAVPPDMVERGISGHVVATQMLDRLASIQSQTDSLRGASSYANDWDGDIAVEIPNTGVSIGEVRRYLRAWLGNQTRLSGEVFRLVDGRIAVTTRIGANPGKRFEGTAAELDTLVGQAAEAIYAETQPYRYTVWLNQQQRFDEARPILLQLTMGKDENDKVWANHALAILAETPEEKDRWHNAVLRVRPDFVPVLYNMSVARAGQGREEEAYRLDGQLLSRARGLRRELDPGRAAFILTVTRAARAAAEGDFRQAALLREASSNHTANRANRIAIPLNIVIAHLQAHDLAKARRTIAEYGLDTAEGASELNTLMQSADILGSAMAGATGDWAKARDIDARDFASIDLETIDYRMSDPTQDIRTSLAEDQARLGAFDEARATIAPTRMDCAPCIRRRGLIEALAGNGNAADRWMARAVQLAPSLPAAHTLWAEIYLMRHDPGRAIAQARLAVETGPKWADPRKFWGDALMLQNRPADAARKYREAVRLAPNWGALHLALGRAEAAAGWQNDARESYRMASRLDLSAEDRAAVAALLRR